jgi:TorA maturation chaperone TorD
MKPLAAETVFLGQALLRPDVAGLRAIARELGLQGWEQELSGCNGDLELEYNRLFLNPLGTPCLPWQSAHGEESRLMGESHLSALEWFRRFGVEPAANNEPADHLGLLLLFYAHLIESDAEAGLIEDFRSEHLRWVPEFCDCVERETRLSFYGSVSRHLRAMLTQ